MGPSGPTLTQFCVPGQYNDSVFGCQIRNRINARFPAIAAQRNRCGVDFCRGMVGLLRHTTRLRLHEPIPVSMRGPPQALKRAVAVHLRHHHQNSKPTFVGWLCRFWAFPKPRGVRARSACATAPVSRRIFHRFLSCSIPLCSLFSKNNGEPRTFGTRRMRFRSTGCACVAEGSSERQRKFSVST